MEIRNFSIDIDKFLDDLEEITRSKVSRVLNILEIAGNDIEMPYSKSLGEGLFELRISGKIPIRIIYCFFRNYAILLCIFIKKQNKIPKKQLDLARKRQALLV